MAYYTSDRANLAAQQGDLNTIQTLQKFNVHCTSSGADAAAAQGHLHILEYLRKYNIHCTDNAINQATENGHQHIVEFLKLALYLPENIAQYTSQHTDYAAAHGYLDIIDLLHKSGIYCTSNGAKIGILWLHIFYENMALFQ